MELQDTIAAIATANGMGAIGIVRLSGAQAIPIAASVFRGTDLRQVPSHSVHYGTIEQEGKLVDEVMVTVFKAPRSFTTEDMVEISAHGSPYILQEILRSLLQHGARAAEAGEFTMRAFMHGRINLAQAEAVADVIAAENEAQQRVALQQLRGGYSKQIQLLREELIQFAALIELELDFSEEDVEFADRTRLMQLLNHLLLQVNQLRQSFQLGNAIKNGVNTVIAGRPNAGKSTLLNALLEEERAIVSDIPGTTRDVIEAGLHIGGVRFRLMDTAGLREATDAIEKIGVSRTLEKIAQSAVVLFVFDVASMGEEEVLTDLQAIEKDGVLLIPIGNKCDLLSAEEARKKFRNVKDVHFMTAQQASSLETLKERLLNAVQLGKVDLNATIVTNERHFHALEQAAMTLTKVQQNFEDQQPGDLIAADLREALRWLSSITGHIDADRDILGAIFGKFCIGK